jgi:proteasome lid subunit RPN8/RPN11
MREVEECWILVGARRGRTWRARRVRYRRGEHATVTADGAWALAREEARGDVLGFFHTHPMGGLHPSSRDVRTMRAWCDAFGKSLICVIATPTPIGGWRFDDYQSDGERLASVELIGKTKLIAIESRDGRKVPSRTALSRRGSAREAGGAAHHAVRRRRRRVEPGG